MLSKLESRKEELRTSTKLASILITSTTLGHITEMKNTLDEAQATRPALPRGAPRREAQASPAIAPHACCPEGGNFTYKFYQAFEELNLTFLSYFKRGRNTSKLIQNQMKTLQKNQKTNYKSIPLMGIDVKFSTKY